MWDVRGKLKIGDVVTYESKKYMVLYYAGDISLCCMVAGIIRLYDNWHPLIRKVKEVYDSDIEKFEITKRR